MGFYEPSATTSAHYATPDLQRANDFQAALIGMAGHDLRQPLQIIQSTYELLRNRACSTSEKVWLDTGERAVGRLLEQLDRLLDAVRLYEYTRTMDTSRVALAPLFWRLCNENEDAALRRAIDMRVHSTEASVGSNPVLLSGILRNLVSNAIKYTDPGGRILIGCRRSGCEVRIDVYDTGIGIAPGQMQRIFDAFERIDAERCDGLGLGLFLVRRAIDLLGHRIEISSVVSQGSRFSVFAPRAR
jgi:two-component system, OmpR family, phosphate regulon sensor histidine kinase PhoR